MVLIPSVSLSPFPQQEFPAQSFLEFGTKLQRIVKRYEKVHVQGSVGVQLRLDTFFETAGAVISEKIEKRQSGGKAQKLTWFFLGNRVKF